MWSLLTSRFNLVVIGVVVALITALGWQVYQRHQVEENNRVLIGDIEELKRDQQTLEMQINALTITRYTESQARQQLQEGTNNVRQQQQAINERVTRDVQQINDTGSSQTNEDDRRAVANSVANSLRDAYCLAVPTASDCTP